MTITFLAPDGVAVTAQQERQARAAGHGGGSGRQLGGRSGFRVGTPSTVLTATSTTWTLTPCAAMIDPGASTHQGMYGWSTDANVTGAVTAADATNPRKDIVYIQVNDSSAGDGSGATDAPVLYLAGAPGVSPTAPALPARSFLVGTITVPQVGGGSPTVVLNPDRYVAAGAPLPVNLAARDALTKYDTLTVQRTDLTGRPVETWDGAAWTGLPVSTLETAPTGYSWAGSVTVEQRGGRKHVTVDMNITRTGADASITTTFSGLGTILPATARTAAVPTKYFPVSLSGGGNNVLAAAALSVDTGVLSIRGVSAFTWTTGALFTVNLSYYI